MHPFAWLSYGVNGLSFVEIVTAIERLVNEDCAVDWGGEGKDFITSKYDGKALDIYIYKGIWKKRFRDASWGPGYTLGRTDNNHWSIINTALASDGTTLVKWVAQNESESLTTQNLLTSSPFYQRKPFDTDKQKLHEGYNKIQVKWMLESGRAVEDIIYHVVKDFTHEQ